MYFGVAFWDAAKNAAKNPANGNHAHFSKNKHGFRSPDVSPHFSPHFSPHPKRRSLESRSPGPAQGR